MKIIHIFLSTLLIFLAPLHGLKNTTLSPEDIASLMPNTLELYDETLINAPADISFTVADLKYNHGSFMIVECGNGPYCGLKPHPMMVNSKIAIMTTPYWEIIDQLLSKYNIPLWFVGLRPPQPLPFFTQHNKKPILSFKNFTATNTFREHKAQSPIKPTQIASHLGIVLYRKHNLRITGDDFFEFKKNHPAFLLVNSNSSAYFSCKKATYKLFSDAGLSDYLPRHAIYETSNYKQRAQQILRDFPLAQLFVIKPLGKYRSYGVGITTAEHLHEHINHMFGSDPIQQHEEKSIGYWRKNNDTHFMVNEFMPSQSIIYNEKIYDPTMRIVMLMTHEAGIITINIIGACWKIPPCAIDDERGTLTQRHVTDPDRRETLDGILIAPDDLASMKAVVAPVFAQAYKTILEKLVP